MSRPSTFFSSGSSRFTLFGGAIGILGILAFGVLVFGVLATATAQYRSSYPYSRPPTTSRQLPSTTRHVGGFTGNPYRNDRTAPSGLPVSKSLRSYYGGTGGGNPYAQRSVSKPFSNLQRQRPLVTSREAARIEVARGLWGW
ncbi:MAG: hypothetical protein GXP26_17960 [Planctomycetes bacterium]|nr:hypothetical protein [Planctomycetota bacterium]